MAMKKGAPSLFSESDKQLAKQGDDSDHEHAAFNSDYEEQGFSYGAEWERLRRSNQARA